MKKTKIICTIGPSSSNEEMMRKMLLAGMDVARLNFSHGTHETHKKNIDLFRSVRDELGVPAAVLLDTKGPEIRIGDFKDGKACLKAGERFVLTSDDSVLGDSGIVSTTFKRLPTQVKNGDKILVDDGRVELRVESVTETDVICTG